MDYDLSRIDYTICGITYPNTMKILPSSGQKMDQKFAIGDKNGVLQCLSIKEEESLVHFKTLPGKPITSVQLTSANGAQGDKIFAASGNEVKGYTRKGKVFLTIETSVSETITSMCILGIDLILCSGRTVTTYRDLREFNSYICEDRVLDVAAFAAPNSTRVRLLVLIANKGAAILENGQLIARTAIPAGPCRLAIPSSLHGVTISALYGAGDGSIGLIVYEQSVLSSNCLVDGRSLGSVMCLGWFFNNSNTHLAVGRHDGSVQLYLIDMDSFTEKPRLKFTYFCGEPVTSIGGGCVGSEENELLVATYSGRVFALRASYKSGIVGMPKMTQDSLAARRAKLELEVARLEKQTANERDKYQRNTRSMNAGLSTPPLLDIQYELTGANRDGCQEARIMSAVPLDMLFIYCIKKLEIQTDNAAVLSICSSQGTASDLLATVRCQAGTRRVWVRMRNKLDTSTASRSESLLVFIYALPAGAPRVARLITLRLPALPYYSQYEDLDLEKQPRSWCLVRVSGSFSVAEMTSWLTEALPGDLPRPAANIHFARSHILLGTVLICRYQRSLAVFKTDNVSTMAVIRNMVSNSSVEKGIRVEISYGVFLLLYIPDNCCIKSFENLEDQFKLEYQKKKDIIMRKAISKLEVDMNGKDEAPVLCEDYARVWGSSSEELSETSYNELVDTIVQWNIDWHALSMRGDNNNNENTRLRKALHECNLEDVKKILSKEPLTPQELTF